MSLALACQYHSHVVHVHVHDIVLLNGSRVSNLTGEILNRFYCNAMTVIHVCTHTCNLASFLHLGCWVGLEVSHPIGMQLQGQLLHVHVCSDCASPSNRTSSHIIVALSLRETSINRTAVPKS